MSIKRQEFKKLLPGDEILEKIEVPFLTIVLNHALESLGKLSDSVSKNKMAKYISKTIIYIDDKTDNNKQKMRIAASDSSHHKKENRDPEYGAFDTAYGVAFFAVDSVFSTVAIIRWPCS